MRYSLPALYQRQREEAVRRGLLEDIFKCSEQPNLIQVIQQRLAEKVRGQMYENLNERYEFDYEVKDDLKAYMENTAGARDALKKDVAEWKQARTRVNDMYAAAWNYQVAETKYPPSIFGCCIF